MRASARALLLLSAMVMALAAPALAQAWTVGDPLLPASTSLVAGAPVNTAAPAISGAIRTGQVLTVSLGTWTLSPTSFAYQWQRDTGSGWADIPGATSSSYALAAADSGAEIQAVVTATNGSGSTSAPSPGVGPVDAAIPTSIAAPVIAGTPRRGQTLVVSTGSWNPAGASYAYQWQEDSGGGYADIAGATGSAYTLTPGDVGATVRVLITATNGYGASTAATAATAPVTAAPPVNTATPSVTGTTKRTYTLSVTSGTWSPNDSTYAYQWQRDTGSGYADIAGATGSTYVLAAADVGAHVRAQVTATNPDGTTTASSAGTAQIQTAAPVVVNTPLITGGTRIGDTLTASTGTWSPAATSFSYQWQRDAGGGFADIAGATAPTYTIPAGDLGTRLRVKVVATNADGSGNGYSGTSALVTSPPAATVAPAAPAGTLMDTYVLTADPGTWTPSSAAIGYQWLRCPLNAATVTSSCISVGSGATYRLSSDDVGHPMAVRVTASSAGGVAYADSPLTAPVDGRPLSSLAPPQVAGTAQVMETVHVTPGSWSVPTLSVKYQWQRCAADGTACADIAGATAAQYLVTAADSGHQLAVREDATSPGRTASATSPTVVVADQPLPVATTQPEIVGTPTRTQWLRVTPGAWTNKPSRIAYQWQRCDGDGTNCADIAGRITASYQLTGLDVGHTMTVTVRATNTAGTQVVNTALTAAVAPVLPVIRTLPEISGTLQVPSTLQAIRSTWQTTPDTHYVYQWQRCDPDGTNCADITGATGPIYKLATADAGHALRVSHTATNVDGTVTAVSAPSTPIVPARPGIVTYPRISIDGSPVQVGRTLTLTPGTWTPDVTSRVVQFWRCAPRCVLLSTAGATTYTLTSTDAGALMRGSETATGPGGQTTAYASYIYGPVRSASVGTSTLALGATSAVRTASGASVATATVSAAAGAARALPRASAAARRPALARVTVRRVAGVPGALRAWACVTPAPASLRQPCSAAAALGHRATMRLAVARGQRVQVVVTRAHS